MAIKVLVFFMLVSAGAFHPKASIADEYVVGESDALKITVYDHPNLTVNERVSPEGAIDFPLIGPLKVSGLTVSEISTLVSSRLSDGYVVDPKVTVVVSEYRSRRATIMGQINKPGSYVLSGRVSLLDLITTAGGLTKDAGEKAVIKRKAVSGDSTLNIDLKRIFDAGEISHDMFVQDGDSVFIQKAPLFYIMGEVKKPDAYRYENGLSVIKAVIMAGGFSEKAASGRIRILRKVEGKDKIIEKADVDELIMPDDIVIVPESFF